MPLPLPPPLIPGRDPREVTVVFVRHGQAAAEISTNLGAPLSPLGRRQAARVATRLKSQRFTRIIASDLLRAQETATAIIAHHRKTPFRLDRRIREIQMNVLPPERRRVETFCRTLVRTARAGDQILIVAHGNLIRLAVALLCGVDPRRQAFFRTYNTSVTVLAFYAGGKSGHKIILADCTRHLPPHTISNWAAS